MGIKGYNPSVQTKKLQRERMEPPAQPKPKYNGAGEAEIVPGYEISPIMRLWVVRWMSQRDPQREMQYRSEANGTGYEERSVMGPIEWLEEQTGINRRRISGIINGEFHAVPLSQADKILTAAGLSHLIGSEIHVWPNPNWSLERWMGYMGRRGCI